MHRRLLPLALSAVVATALVAGPAVAQRGAANHPQRKMIRSSARAVSAARLHATISPRPLAVNWTALANMKVAEAENGGGAYLSSKKKVYVPGGVTVFNMPPTPNIQYSHMQTYNTTTNKWAAEAEVMPAVTDTGATGWADGAVCSDGAKVYYINGVDGSFLYSVMQIYDPTQPAGSRWSYGTLPSTATAGRYFSQDSGCAWIKGKLYLFGGYGLTDSGPTSTAAIQRLTWVYDPTTDTWTDTTKNIKGSPTLWFGYTNSNKKAFFAGGTANLATQDPSPTVESFTPAAGWVKMPNLPIPGGSDVAGLIAPGMGLLGTSVEVFGGGGVNTGTSTLVLQIATLQCATGCTSWADAGKNLNTARWFGASAYAGGAAPTLYDAGGQTVSGGMLVVTKSAEKTT